MAQFGILQESSDGLKHWVQPGALTAASGSGPRGLAYTDRAVAERDIEKLRAENARMVHASRRSRKYKTHPATYTVIEITAEFLEELEVID